MEQSLKHASFVCRSISKMLSALLVCAGFIWLTALVMVIGQFGTLGFDGASVVAYVLLYGVLVLGVLMMLKLIFMDVVHSKTPFTEKQADRLRLISFLALMFVILEFAFTFGVTFEAIPSMGYEVIVNRGSMEPVVSINIGMLVFSAIMYSLSAIFRYAALLQQLSDETV